MSREVFVDTGGWVAVAVRTDQYHSVAASLYQRLLRERRPLVTTNLVLAEAYPLIYRSGGHDKALAFLTSLRQSGIVSKVYSDAALESAAEAILRRYDDHAFSFTDAVSFALMQVRGVGDAFAFDRHFRTAGFTLIPEHE